MSTEQEDIDAALDNLESDNGVTFDQLDVENDNQNLNDAGTDDQADDQAGDDGADDQKNQNDSKDDTPPGYIGYEEWVESGKDPKKFRGEDAYKDQYDQIQETREVKSQLASMQETLKHVATANDTWRDQQMETMRGVITQELEDAKEASDVDGALAAQAKLDNLKTTPAAPVEQSEGPIISKFRQDNPMTDKKSSRFNADFNADVEGFYNAMVDDLTGQGRRAMSEGQVARCLQLAQKKAADLNPDLFESPRNQRQSAPLKKKKAASTNTTDHRAKLKGVGNPRNKTDSNAAQEMYDMILESGGKEAADNFAKANSGE